MATKKAGPGGPASQLVAFYAKYLATDGVALFTPLCRKDLAKWIPAEHVSLIEAACTIGNYADRSECANRNAAARRLLRKRGVKLPRGKRAAPETVGMVDSLVGLLEDLDMPLRTGETSVMVLVLRRVAAELDLRGDPRDRLRRIHRQRRASQDHVNALVAKVFMEVFGAG